MQCSQPPDCRACVCLAAQDQVARDQAIAQDVHAIRRNLYCQVPAALVPSALDASAGACLLAHA